jgi:GTPase SAR1 family protein
MRDMYIRTSDTFILCFDITSRSSWDLLPVICEIIQRVKAVEYPLMIICGTKGDLDQERVVTVQEARDLAKKFKIEYIETSALSDTNIQLVFENITNMWLSHRIDYAGICARIDKPHNKKKKCMIM